MDQREYQDANAELAEQEGLLRSRIQSNADELLHPQSPTEAKDILHARAELLEQDSALTEQRTQLLRQDAAQTDEQKNP